MSKAKEAEKQALPSLPQVLIRILDAVQADATDFSELATVILQDAGMAARLVTAANSPFYYRGNPCRSVDRALFMLGLDTVKSLALTASIQQLFGGLNQQHRGFLRQVWHRALVTANLAQVLATLTRYPHPEEAYLCGLLVDIGRLIRLTEDDAGYWDLLQTHDEQTLLQAEIERFGETHCEFAATCMDTWGLGSLMSDAVRYHQEPAEQVQDAHHLVKLLNAAYQLGQHDAVPNDAALAAADRLFGLNEGLARELQRRVTDDVTRLAGSLDIDIEPRGEAGATHAGESPADRPPVSDGPRASGTAGAPVVRDAGIIEADRRADRALGQRIGDLSQLHQFNQTLSRAPAVEGRRSSAQRALFITLGVEHSLIFQTDAGGQTISTWIDAEATPAFTLPLESERSLVTDALLQRRPVFCDDPSTRSLPVVDRQLLRLCRADALWAFPLVHEDQPRGVLVLGLTADQPAPLRERTLFIQALAREIAATLGEAPETEANAQLALRIRETVHEASNPLSIIQNYLGLLRVKLGEEHAAQRELDLIKGEIDRVGRILLRLRDPTPETAGAAPESLHSIVRQVTDIVAQSLCEARGIDLQVDLGPVDTSLLGPLSGVSDSIRQILTNLLKNATEALAEGGVIRVRTRAPVTLNGRPFTQLVIEDNGPGLPPAVEAALFSPVKSTKGAGHSGLGLSIVKRLVESIGATIIGASGPEGTRFELFLPRPDAGPPQTHG